MSQQGMRTFQGRGVTVRNGDSAFYSPASNRVHCHLSHRSRLGESRYPISNELGRLGNYSRLEL